MKPSDMSNHDLLAEYDEVRDTPIRDLSDDSHDALQYRLEELRGEILSRMCLPYPTQVDIVTLPFIMSKDSIVTKEMQKSLEEKGYLKLGILKKVKNKHGEEKLKMLYCNLCDEEHDPRDRRKCKGLIKEKLEMPIPYRSHMFRGICGVCGEELEEDYSCSNRNQHGKEKPKADFSRLQVGKNYLIRTVTMIQVGEFVDFDEKLNAIILKNASWIPDTGRFHDCLKTGSFKEVEPFPDWVAVNMGSIVDLVPFNHSLPTEQK